MTRRWFGWLLCAGTVLGQDANVSGDWIWTIQGPQGEDIDINVNLKQEGSNVTGVFDMGDRKLPVEKGSIEGNVLKLTVKRNRPQGGTMTYEMEGKVEGDKINGTTKADLDGQLVTQELKARRKS
ncbi:MAG: hypothetical protein IT161_02885 [Bryobacterales bacterium]|nr:hypothetical protein [Bryobacterales bacterium]